MKNFGRDPVIYKKGFHFVYEAMFECVIYEEVDLQILVQDDFAPDSFKGTVSRLCIDKSILACCLYCTKSGWRCS
jgi:hypothetical protein